MIFATVNLQALLNHRELFCRIAFLLLLFLSFIPVLAKLTYSGAGLFDAMQVPRSRKKGAGGWMDERVGSDGHNATGRGESGTATRGPGKAG